MNKQIIENYLIEKGVKTNLRGFGYLVTAIDIYEPCMPVCKKLYRMVADAHQTTALRVERAIRTAIEQSVTGHVVNSEYISYAKIMCGRREK